MYVAFLFVYVCLPSLEDAFCVIYFCTGLTILSVRQNCIHSQQGEQETVSFKKRCFPSLAPFSPSLSLFLSDLELSFKESGLSLHPDLIVSKVYAHLLTQVGTY